MKKNRTALFVIAYGLLLILFAVGLYLVLTGGIQ